LGRPSARLLYSIHRPQAEMGHGASRQRDASTTHSQQAAGARARNGNTVPSARSGQSAHAGGAASAIHPSARVPAQIGAQHTSHNLNSGAVNVHNARLPPIDKSARVSDLASELMSCKAKLAQAQQKLKEQPGVPNTECIVCMDAAVDTVLLPCGHLCMCNSCCQSLTKAAKCKAQSLKCPLCRAVASSSQRIYLHVEKPAPPPIAVHPDARRNAHNHADLLSDGPMAVGGTRIALSAQPPRGRLGPHNAPVLNRNESNSSIDVSNAVTAFQPALLENSNVISFSKSMPAGFALRRPTSAVW